MFVWHQTSHAEPLMAHKKRRLIPTSCDNWNFIASPHIRKRSQRYNQPLQTYGANFRAVYGEFRSQLTLMITWDNRSYVLTPARQAGIIPLRFSLCRRPYINTHTSPLGSSSLLERAKTWVSEIRVRGTKSMLIAHGISTSQLARPCLSALSNKMSSPTSRLLSFPSLLAYTFFFSTNLKNLFILKSF